MTTLEDLLPVHSDRREQYGTEDKRIVRATLTIEINEPGPNKQIVRIRTRDGWIYRFQRFGDDEPLVIYDRQRPDGTTLLRPGVLPRSVEQYVDAIEAGEIATEIGQVVSRDAQRIAGRHAIADGGQTQPETIEVNGPARRLSADTIESGRLSTDSADNTPY